MTKLQSRTNVRTNPNCNGCTFCLSAQYLFRAHPPSEYSLRVQLSTKANYDIRCLTSQYLHGMMTGSSRLTSFGSRRMYRCSSQCSALRFLSLSSAASTPSDVRSVCAALSDDLPGLDSAAWTTCVETADGKSRFHYSHHTDHITPGE